MRLMVLEKRKFNWLVLGLLSATILVWTMRIAQEGQLFLPF